MILQVLGAFVVGIAGSIILNAPKKVLPYAAMVSATGWFAYLQFEHVLSISMSTFYAGLFIALFSHIVARIVKVPVTLFLVTGFLPLVPGAGMYALVFAFIQGDLVQANLAFRLVLEVAGMIALSIFVVDSIFRILFRPSSGEFTKP